MTFLLADTFTDSLSRLTGEEQKAIKTTALDLQMNPANSGNHPLHLLGAAAGCGTSGCFSGGGDLLS